jgi:hypothetical protein
VECTAVGGCADVDNAWTTRWLEGLTGWKERAVWLSRVTGKEKASRWAQQLRSSFFHMDSLAIYVM